MLTFPLRFDYGHAMVRINKPSSLTQAESLIFTRSSGLFGPDNLF